MAIKSIENVKPLMLDAGGMALEAQRNLRFADRDTKEDGSIVTEADRRVEEFLFERISALYPEANVLTEETARDFDPAKPYTFAVDPIDGTDVFSLGMGGWSVSVGLFDDTMTPIAGVIVAPRLDLQIFADVGEPVELNGKAIAMPGIVQPLSERSNVMTTSRIHHEIDLSGYPGKLRSIGSAALHLSFPIIHPGVFAALEGSAGHIWDIAGAHAVNCSLGLDFVTLSGGRVDYAGMIGGEVVGEPILAGPRDNVDALRRVLVDASI